MSRRRNKILRQRLEERLGVSVRGPDDPDDVSLLPSKASVESSAPPQFHEERPLPGGASELESTAACASVQSPSLLDVRGGESCEGITSPLRPLGGSCQATASVGKSCLKVRQVVCLSDSAASTAEDGLDLVRKRREAQRPPCSWHARTGSKIRDWRMANRFWRSNADAATPRQARLQFGENVTVRFVENEVVGISEQAWSEPLSLDEAKPRLRKRRAASGSGADDRRRWREILLEEKVPVCL